MQITNFEELEIGDDLPEESPDVSMATVTAFCHAAKHVFERFIDHEAAKGGISCSHRSRNNESRAISVNDSSLGSREHDFGN